MPKRRVKRHLVTQPVDKPYRYIPLTQEQTAIVDIADFEWLSQWNWFAWWCKSTKSFYARRTEEGKTILMHRIIAQSQSDKETDHQNNDTLDNRRENLRACTHGQNQRNGGKYSNNKSGYRGVSLAGNTWRAVIQVDGKSINIGRFKTKEEAALAYDTAARFHHGKFAHTNYRLST